MIASIRVAPLPSSQPHRSTVEAILRAAGVFSDAEVAVALEVFDAGVPASDGAGAQSVDYELIGAFRDDTLVGYACIGPTPATEGTYDLYWIAVHPDAQGAGVGAALMADIEQRLSDRRARLLVIETSSRDDYAPTRRFYQRRGYAESARLRDFYASGDDRIVLTRRVVVPSPAAPGTLPTPAPRI